MKKSNIPSGLYWENAGRLEYSIGLKTNYDKLITKNKKQKKKHFNLPLHWSYTRLKKNTHIKKTQRRWSTLTIILQIISGFVPEERET